MFRKELKDFVYDIHKYVENTPIMTKMINSTITNEEYLRYLIQINSIYKSIEQNEEFIKLGWNIKFQEKCNKDIEEMSMIDKQKLFGITKIYSKYIKNLKNVDAIVAHAYVRYMGDFFGGTIIKNKLPSCLPKFVYDIEKNQKQYIIDYIEHKIVNKELFQVEVHHAFMAYASILEILNC